MDINLDATFEKLERALTKSNEEFDLLLTFKDDLSSEQLQTLIAEKEKISFMIEIGEKFKNVFALFTSKSSKDAVDKLTTIQDKLQELLTKMEEL